MIYNFLKRIYFSNVYTVVEFLLFFVFIPFIANRYLDGWLKVLPLIGIAIFFFILLRLDSGFEKKNLYTLNKPALKKSVPRLIIVSVLLMWFTWWIFPDLLLYYPKENFESYLITFFLYPIASVIPQEIIYRVYFFHRYKEIIPERFLLMLSNAIIFGLTHWIYANWVAPIATFLVSWIFIYTYLKSKSLLNVSLEHYFYGLIMFTIGFGYFFQ
ncbi:CPBP family intramembrane metalloprotease [Antarcticibacterium arcticum]|uniref:CPBP family intramembrane metalloprotease n=1 Tax=Antarcticibacterium arcticum TaxID=2585771 RepID=A0A5B8YKJ3_9FLAO|nr:CPBP family intramembrane glutamic endopeptidase [Antarcticibacterium arcticum]QED36906.1 CPBP family intramembrane metalloprotease [Antarcticibacterium arcticum]